MTGLNCMPVFFILQLRIMNDSDPMYYVSDPNAVWNIPYYPAGSIDGKVTTSELAKDMSMWGIFGRADGVEFDAEEFLRIHSQWNW